MQIGFMGTMNQMFLDELAKKTKRGQTGRVIAGRIPGGISYGHDMVTGEERGKRSINQEQAAVVRRIFKQYAQGFSPRAIAKQLNAEDIPSPRGGQWQASTINGNVKRGNGILPNQLYIGNIVYNRQSFIKDPSTGKRIARANPQNEWVIQHVPALVIIEPELRSIVSARKSANTNRPEHYRRSRYLISGILQCEECGGPYTVSGQAHMRCSHNRERGTCSNKSGIKIADVENRILSALKNHLLDPVFVETFVFAYKEEWGVLEQGNTTASHELQTAKKNCEQAIKSLIYALETGIISTVIAKKLQARESELIDITAKINATLFDKTIPLPTDLIKRWRQTLHNIEAHISKDAIGSASEDLRNIVKSVTVIPKHKKTYDLEITGFLEDKVGCGGRI